jgi:hypothetical protein
MDKRELIVHLGADGKGTVVFNGMQLPTRSIEIRGRVGEVTTALVELIGVSVNAEVESEIKRNPLIEPKSIKREA